MTNEEVAKSLTGPFAAGEISFKPQSVKGNRALALAYIDARTVMNRLDNVLGIGNWQSDFEVLPEGSVICRLRLRLPGGDEWIIKTDVGSPSEQSDAGDRLKAAFSDSLKRAAVHIGIGRFLYDLPSIWHEYDPVAKKFVSDPKLPDWAIIRAPAVRTAANTTAATAPESEKPQKMAPELPKNGQELRQRLAAKDKELAEARRIQAGGLTSYVTSYGFEKRWNNEIDKWNADQIAEAAKIAGEWIAKLPKPQ